MERKHSSVRLDPKEFKELEKIAKDKHLPVAYIIREAVREYLERSTKGGK
jgi:predicted transcriptional regulator